MTLQPTATIPSGKFSHLVFDYDLFCYDIGWAAEQGEGQPPLSFSWVKDVIDTRIWEIRQKLSCGVYHGYLSGSTNFRDDIATRDIYKGNRKSEKPHWYSAIRHYLVQQHHAEVVEGIEADDALAMFITNNPNAVCISRDKDLRQVPGWHFGYSVGNQREYGPYLSEDIGELSLNKSKLKGTGLKFFYSQVLTGDPTDNYKGLPGCGPVGAYNALCGLETNEEMYLTVLDMYKEKYPETAAEELLEQARLAWMVREVSEDGEPVMWEPPDV